MFGDAHWDSARSDDQEERFAHWLDTMPYNTRLTVIEVGAGPTISTIRNLSEETVRERRGVMVRINPRDSYGPEGTISLELGSLAALEALNRSIG